MAGKYIYIDASSPRVQGDKAWFVSQDFSPNMASCLHFWYNMNGGTIGNLNVWVQQSSDGSRRPIWSLSGNQGTAWFQGQAAIPQQTASYQVNLIRTVMTVIFSCLVLCLPVTAS